MHILSLSHTHTHAHAHPRTCTHTGVWSIQIQTQSRRKHRLQTHRSAHTKVIQMYTQYSKLNIHTHTIFLPFVQWYLDSSSIHTCKTHLQCLPHLSHFLLLAPINDTSGPSPTALLLVHMPPPLLPLSGWAGIFREVRREETPCLFVTAAWRISAWPEVHIGPMFFVSEWSRLPPRTVSLREEDAIVSSTTHEPCSSFRGTSKHAHHWSGVMLGHSQSLQKCWEAS